MLTALHVVRPHLADPYHPAANASGVRCLAVTGGPAGEGVFECAVVWQDEAADLALLQIAEGRRDVWKARLTDDATVLADPGTDPVRDVSAIGFPDATLATDANRPDPDQLTGTLLPSSGVPGRIGFDVSTSTPDNHPLWRGLSGAAVREASSGRLLAIVAQALPDRAARRLYASPLPDPDTDRGWAAALAQVEATPVLEDRHAPEARRFLTCHDPAGRPWRVGRVPQLGDFGVRRARDDLAPDNQPYFPYVGRPEADSVEAALNAALVNVDAPRFVLLVGESAAGKSRLAAEVVTRMPALAEHRFIRPAPAERVGDLPEAFRRGRVLLWLDDLHRYLASGLDAQRARVLLTNAHLVIVATLLREWLDESGFKTAVSDLLTGALVARIDIPETPSWSIADGADPADARVARAALAAAGDAGVGLGEYLAAYAELRNSYRNAGPWARALIDCVTDWSRTGMPTALPESLARDLWRAHYLSAVHARQWDLKTDDNRESIYQAARKDATTSALGSTALLADTRDGLSPSDVAIIERHAAAIPDRIWMAAAQIAAKNPTETDSVAFQAARAGQDQIAESLWASLPDRAPRALFNLGLVGRLRLVRQTYMRKARDEPHNLAQTAGSMIGEVVGRDALCNVIIEDLNDPGIRRPHVVIGGVGVGKTALLVRLTKLLAERGVVPVPVRLRDAQESLNFRELARTRFVAETRTMSLSNTEGETLWSELWRNDQVVVLADGLEEALIEGNAQNERDSLIRIAIRQANAQRLPLVITSRLHDSLRDIKAAVVELEPLSEEAALAYVGQWESGEDSRRLGWIVETADMVEAPLYLQITRQLYRAGLIEYVTPPRNDRRLDTRSMDREELRLLLLQTWMQALIDGHFLSGLALSRDDRQAAIEQLSLLACVGLQRDRFQVRFDQAESLRTDPPPAIIAEVDERLGRLKRRYDLGLAAAWGTQVGLVEARGDGVRFPHGIMQAYLASRLIDVAMADPGFRDDALAKSGREFLIALVMYSRARLQTPRSNSAARGSRLAAQPGAERTTLDFLRAEASRRTDVKALDLYAAALQIDSVEKQPAHSDIAAKLQESWPDITSRDQRTLEEAKLNVVHRFGETARTISEQHRQGQGYPAEAAYLRLYRIGCLEPSYPIQLACAQEIGMGGDEAFDALAAALGPPVVDRSKGHATARAEGSGTAASALPPRGGVPGLEEDQKPENRAWKEGIVRAWLAPLLAGSVTERKSPAANKNLEQWLQYLGKRTHTRAESDLCLSLEVALAQGFKHAANRRRRHPHARPEARTYLAEQAREMLRDSHFWFTRLTLLHAVCLWSLRDDQPSRRDRRHVDYGSLVNNWVTFRLGMRQHPFVKQAGKLAVLALETGHPERFIWIDESGVMGKVGGRLANLRAPRQHNLWIPPSTGWTALDPRAQQLVADVLLLLNLAERGGRLSERNRRLHRIDRPYLPPCLDGDRSPLDPTRTVGTAETPEPGSNCKEGCPFGLCPYPPKGETSYRIELSGAFCRGQQALLSSGSIRRRAAPWQQTAPGDLKQFWKQMEQRAQSV